LATRGGFVHVSTVNDCYAKKVEAIADRMHTRIRHRRAAR